MEKWSDKTMEEVFSQVEEVIRGGEEKLGWHEES